MLAFFTVMCVEIWLCLQMCRNRMTFNATERERERGPFAEYLLLEEKHGIILDITSNGKHWMRLNSNALETSRARS